MRFRLLDHLSMSAPVELIAEDFVDRRGRPALTPSDAEFAYAFSSAWLQIPVPERQSIAGLWAKGPDPATVELIEIKPVLGWMAAGSRRLAFDRKTLWGMPREIIADLVMHELAHVFQAAGGMAFRSKGAMELDADLRCDRWRPGSVCSIDHFMNGRIGWLHHPLTQAEIDLRSQPGGRYHGA
jgi:hypothetical protein